MTSVVEQRDHREHLPYEYKHLSSSQGVQAHPEVVAELFQQGLTLPTTTPDYDNKSDSSSSSIMTEERDTSSLSSYKSGSVGMSGSGSAGDVSDMMLVAGGASVTHPPSSGNSVSGGSVIQQRFPFREPLLDHNNKNVPAITKSPGKSSSSGVNRPCEVHTEYEMKGGPPRSGGWRNPLTFILRSGVECMAGALQMLLASAVAGRWITGRRSGANGSSGPQLKTKKSHLDDDHAADASLSSMEYGQTEALLRNDNNNILGTPGRSGCSSRRSSLTNDDDNRSTTSSIDAAAVSTSPVVEAPPYELMIDVEHEPPSILKSSPKILTTAMMDELAQTGLPAFLVGMKRWKRLYSVSRDGDAFETFLHHVRQHKHTVIVIRTMEEDVFGGFVDTEWERHGSVVGASYYGTGQSFLFTFSHYKHDAQHRNSRPKATIYRWTGANNYNQLCDSANATLAMGGGGQDASFGLCVEDCFRRGSTGPCDTYGNPRGLLSRQNKEFFEILAFEVYGFVNPV